MLYVQLVLKGKLQLSIFEPNHRYRTNYAKRYTLHQRYCKINVIIRTIVLLRQEVGIYT